jgi:hypothetical protein
MAPGEGGRRLILFESVLGGVATTRCVVGVLEAASSASVRRRRSEPHFHGCKTGRIMCRRRSIIVFIF